MIEYLISGPDGSQGAGFLVDDVDVLVPQHIDCQQIPDQPVLTVGKQLWQVTYSAEPAGWKLSFTELATQIECWRFASAVAEQLEEATGITASIRQVDGFDGGVFRCVGAFGLESQNSVVLEGTVVTGEIDSSMAVFLPTNAIGSNRLELSGVEFVDRADPASSAVGLVCPCDDWEDVQELIRLTPSDVFLEVSHRTADGWNDLYAEVAAAVAPHIDIVERISALLFRHDPMNINYETNTDEYDPEAKTIVLRLLDVSDFTTARVHRIVHEEFRWWFSALEAGPFEHYEQIAHEVTQIAVAAFPR